MGEVYIVLEYHMTSSRLLNGIKYLKSVSEHHYSVHGESNFLCHSRTCRKCIYSHICFCSMNWLCFYLWRTSKTENEEKDFRYSVLSCQRETMFCFFGIIAEEETSYRRVRSIKILFQCSMVYLLAGKKKHKENKKPGINV
jgi:hypothetical protein